MILCSSKTAEDKQSRFVVPAGVNSQAWTFEAPIHWNRRRLRLLCDINPPVSTLPKVSETASVAFVPMELAREGDPMFVARSVSRTEIPNGLTPFCDGDVLMAKITPCFENGKGGIAANLESGIGFGSTEFHVLRPGLDIDCRFLYYVTISKPFRDVGTKMMQGAAGQQRVPTEFLLDFVLPYPSRTEQATLSQFLDRANRRISRLIRAKRRQIELLNEQKQAIIHQAVTRGLDPDVPLKPSGIDWLGDVPAHWDEITIRHCSESLQTGPFGSQLHAHEYVSGGIPIINPSHLSGGRIVHSTDITVSPETAERLARHRLAPGDILFARRGELGRCGLVSDAEAGWLCGTGCIRMRPRQEVFDPEYLLLVLSSVGVADVLRLQSVGATMDNLNTSIVGQLRIPRPSIAQQRRIVEFVASETALVDYAVDRTHQEMRLLREYRTRLIADVVTGKLDVRGVELPELDEAGDAAWDETDDELGEGEIEDDDIDD